MEVFLRQEEAIEQYARKIVVQRFLNDEFFRETFPMSAKKKYKEMLPKRRATLPSKVIHISFTLCDRLKPS